MGCGSRVSVRTLPDQSTLHYTTTSAVSASHTCFPRAGPASWGLVDLGREFRRWSLKLQSCAGAGWPVMVLQRIIITQCLLTPTGGVNNCHKLTIYSYWHRLITWPLSLVPRLSLIGDEREPGDEASDHYVVHISPEAYSYRPIDVLLHLCWRAEQSPTAW